jgi:hypothetical protein
MKLEIFKFNTVVYIFPIRIFNGPYLYYYLDSYWASVEFFSAGIFWPNSYTINARIDGADFNSGTGIIHNIPVF